MVKASNLRKVSDMSLRVLLTQPKTAKAAAAEIARRNKLENFARKAAFKTRLEPQQRKRLSQLGGLLSRVTKATKKAKPEKGRYFDRLSQRYSK